MLRRPDGPVAAAARRPPRVGAGGGAPSVVAVDVGGTSIKGVRLTTDGRQVATSTATTPVAAGQAAVLAEVARVAADLVDAGTCAVGLCCPGVLDTDEGVVRYAANLGLRDAPLVDVVRRRTSVPVRLEHDVRAACLAEGRLGAGAGVDDLLLLVLGTGIAGGLVVGGRPVAGASRAAGEVGHLPVRPGGDPCSCGQRGCLEVYASAGGLVRRYRQSGGSSSATAEDLARSAAAGDDPLAARLWEEGAQALGTALVTATLMLDPALVVLAGGLTGAGDQLLRPVRAAVDAGLAWRPAPPVVVSPLGSRAGVLGAALHALDAEGVEVPGWEPASAG